MAVVASSRHVSLYHPPSGWGSSSRAVRSRRRRRHGYILDTSTRRGASMGLPVTAKQDEVSGIPIPALRGFYEAIGDGPIMLDLEAFVEWQGKGTRATGYIGPFSLMGERKERLTRKYSDPVRRLGRDARLRRRRPRGGRDRAVGPRRLHHQPDRVARGPHGHRPRRPVGQGQHELRRPGLLPEHRPDRQVQRHHLRDPHQPRRAPARRSSPSWPTSAATARCAGCSASRWC